MSRKFFVDKIDNEVVKIGGDEFNHIINVLRYKTGDSIVLCDKAGNNFKASILSVSKSELTAKVEQELGIIAEPKTDICLAVASLKSDKLEFVCQKITELGLNTLIIFNSKFCEKPAEAHKLDRLNKIAVEAAKQCGRSKIINIIIAKNLKELCNYLNEYNQIFLAYENSTNSLSDNLQINSDKVALIVGSEGGFDKTEIDFLSGNLKTTKQVSMGKRILRAETACIALSCIAMFCCNELS